ncbi:jg11517 [Pararge aegeria aegeria]|uniref:Jg11517 protein n=1 Tax=Pararge aegeria aegeria TaxID=348720 RepID=A0A8S4RLP7_9NEOP|nr:jg11517 [Pararge aegeria aegeria]
MTWRTLRKLLMIHKKYSAFRPISASDNASNPRLKLLANNFASITKISATSHRNSFLPCTKLKFDRAWSTVAIYWMALPRTSSMLWIRWIVVLGDSLATTLAKVLTPQCVPPIITGLIAAKSSRGVHYTARHLLRPVIIWVANFPFNSPPARLQLMEAGGHWLLSGARFVSCERGVLMFFLCLAPPPPLRTSPPRKKRQQYSTLTRSVI